MASVRLNGDTSGFIEISAPNVAGSTTITLPATSGGNFLVTDSNGDLNVDSGTLFVDASTDRVGIGTTSPVSALEIVSDVNSAQLRVRASSSGNRAQMRYTNAHSIWETGILGDTSGDFLIAGSTEDTDIIFFTRASGANQSEKIRIDSAGRLLVGTIDSTGTQLLKVNGTTGGSTNGGAISLTQGRTAPPNGSTHGVINFGSETRPDGGATIFSTAEGAWTDGSSHPSTLIFSTTASGATSPTERMRINAAGYLDCHQGAGAAFGDDAHAFRHDATTNTFVSKFIHEGTNTPKGISIQYRNASPNASGSPFLICLDNNSNTFARINSNGGFWNVQSNDSNICDEREKKNIVNLDSTWNCLKEWELKKFHYNDDADDSDLRYGVIAQQIATSCPEVITDWVKQEAVEAVLDQDGNELQPAREEIVRMGVKEQQMYWMAIRALQEAQIRIETLETANASLEARLTALEGGN